MINTKINKELNESLGSEELNNNLLSISLISYNLLEVFNKYYTSNIIGNNSTDLSTSLTNNEIQSFINTSFKRLVLSSCFNKGFINNINYSNDMFNFKKISYESNESDILLETIDSQKLISFSNSFASSGLHYNKSNRKVKHLNNSTIELDFISSNNTSNKTYSWNETFKISKFDIGFGHAICNQFKLNKNITIPNRFRGFDGTFDDICIIKRNKKSITDRNYWFEDININQYKSISIYTFLYDDNMWGLVHSDVHTVFLNGNYNNVRKVLYASVDDESFYSGIYYYINTDGKLFFVNEYFNSMRVCTSIEYYIVATRGEM